MSLSTMPTGASSEAGMQDKTLEGCIALTMLRQSVPTEAYRTAWPSNYSGLSISTARPTTAPTMTQTCSKSSMMATAPTDFSKLRINTGAPKKSQKPRSPTSITDIIGPCAPKKPLVPEMPLVPDTPRVPMTPHVTAKSQVPLTPHIPERSGITIPRIPETSQIPVAPHIPETHFLPEQPCIPSAPLATHENLGKIVCKKCNRLLDRARRCCGTYSVALTIRVEHIPEQYRPRVGCSGAIRAHFPSFAKASRYRMFLANQMRKKRKLRFLVEFEDSEEDTRKRQRNGIMENIPTTQATSNTFHKNVAQSTGYNAANYMGVFNTYSFSPTIPWQFNQQLPFASGLRHGLTPPIAGLPREKLFLPPPD